MSTFYGDVMISTEEIKAKLTVAFPDAQIEVVDTTGTHDHFSVVVVTPAFAGLTRVRQHQAVYAALGDDMKQRIHALALKTAAPE
jgi:stress-induced morphogen